MDLNLWPGNWFHWTPHASLIHGLNVVGNGKSVKIERNLPQDFGERRIMGEIKKVNLVIMWLKKMIHKRPKVDDFVLKEKKKHGLSIIGTAPD